MNAILGNLISFGWIVDILKKIALFFDWLIYSVGAWFFDAFYKIAKMDITLDGKINSLEVVVDRVQLFIGIFILFMLVKTLIGYLSSPEKVVASTSKIIVNVVVSLALLVSSNAIFDLLADFQKALMDNNTIPKLLLGPSTGEGFTENAGKTYVNSIHSLFYYCADCQYQSQFDAVKNGEAEILSLMEYTNKKGVYYEYPIISTIMGVVLIYYFVVFALALGIRLFKLLMLQMLAPIPIVAYIDPNKKSFCDKYLKLYLNTYLELFVRLGTILLVYNISQLLIETIGTVTSSDKGFLVILLLIVALFQFAKTFPKLISDLFGINTSLSEVKGVASGLFGGIGGAAVGLTAGAITGGMTGLRGKDLLSHISSSAYRNVKGGINAGKQGVGKWTGSMFEGSAASFVNANHIFDSGGYGNFLKGKMLQRVGYDKFDARRGERLTDAVKTSSSLKEKYQGYASSVAGLNDSVYQSLSSALQQSNNNRLRAEGQKIARSYAISKSGGAGVTETEYRDAVNFIDQINISDFYDRGWYGSDDLSNTSSYTSLSQLKNQISAEISDVKDPINGQSVNVNSWSDVKNAQSAISGYISNADANLDKAEATLKDYKSTNAHQNVNFDRTKDNKYKN